MMSTSVRVPMRRALFEAFTVFVVALVVLGPISGVVLEGFGFRSHPLRPVLLAMVVALGRLVITVSLGTRTGLALMSRLDAATSAGARVAPPSPKLLTPWVLALVTLGVLVPFVADKY